MHILRKSVLWLTILLLPLMLFSLAGSFAISRSFGGPEPVKDILADSGLYGSAVDTFLEATDNPTVEERDSLSVDNPIVRQAFQKAFPEEFVQSSAENFIDGTFAWLEGEAAEPNFRIDLREAKATFISEVAAGAEARAESLPACRTGQANASSPLSLTCLPQGVSPEEVGEQIKRDLAREEFLKDPVITAGSIKSADGQSVFANQNLPNIYQKLSGVPLGLALLTLAALLAVVFLSQNHWQGLKKAGIVLLVVGLTILLFSWVAVKAVDSVASSNALQFENTALSERIQALVRDIASKTSKSSMLAGGVYAGLGALAIGTKMFWERRHAPAKKPSPKK